MMSGLMLILISQVYAQTQTINGRVTDSASGQGLPGVTVLVKGTANGTSTDVNGGYTISAPASGILTFSFIGYTTLERTIGNSTSINVTLAPDAQQLGEVVITMPYQTVDPRAITGSVSAVGSSIISKQQVTSVARALQGTTSGTQVLTSVGQPGENPVIRIRGINSINASASPLIVLDGVPYGGNINSLNPNDIESMTVLKDAASSALYGSRAANGVIMITTKQGKVGEPKFEIALTQGFSTRARKEYEFVGAAQYMQLYWEGLRNYATSAGNIADPSKYASDNVVGDLGYNPFNIGRPIGEDGNVVPGAELLWDTDWKKELTRSMSETKRTEALFSASGGTEKSKYFLSFGYLKDLGVAKQSDFERISGRLNLTNKLATWFNLGTNLNISYSDQNYPNQSGSGFTNTIQYYRTLSNIYPVYMRDDNGALLLDANGDPIYDYGVTNANRNVNVGRPVLQNENPLGTMRYNETINRRLTTTANTFGEFIITPSIKFRSTFGIDLYNLNVSEYENPLYGNGTSVNGRASREKDNTVQWTWSNQLSYNKTFNQKHNFNIFGVYEAFKYNYEYFYASATGFPFIGLKELSSSTNNENTSSSLTQSTLTSILGKAGYNYNYKYFIDLSYRQDASSRFSADARKGDFYAVSAAWDAAQESFLQPISFINQLKFRGSYGEMGNNATDSYFPYLGLFGTGYNMLDNPGIILTSLANNNLTWETSKTLDFGLDFGIFNNRLSGSFDWYKKETDGLLFSRDLVPSGGSPPVVENIGSLTNKGYEVTLTSQNINNANFNWSTIVNFSKNKNEFTKLPYENGLNTGSYRYEVGVSAYEWYLEEWAGVDPATGNAQWYYTKKAADGTETREITTSYANASSSRIFAGSALPDYTGGITNNLSWKGLDLTFNVYASIGGKIYDGDYAGLMDGFFNPGQQTSADILNRWQKEGDVTDVPILGTSNDVNSRSTRFLYDATFARLRFVNLGYSLPASITNRAHLNKARIYVQGDNLATLFGREGLDPEQSIGGATSNRSAVMKTVSFGINVGF